MHLQIVRYIPMLGFALFMVWLVVYKWPFIEGALSETDKNGKASGSATRISGIVLILVVAFCEMFTTLKTQEFKYDHLVALLFGIGCLFGFIKVVDLFSIWRGGKLPEAEKKDPPKVTTTTNTETVIQP